MLLGYQNKFSAHVPVITINNGLDGVERSSKNLLMQCYAYFSK